MAKLRIKQIRNDRKETQTQFAQFVGLSQNFISELESGSNNPSMSTLEQISKKLGIPIKELWDDNM